jgi:hypothetical protein
MRYSVREVVGVFPDLASLDKAVRQLEENGVDRAAISVLGVSSGAKGGHSAQAIEDDPSAPRLPFWRRLSARHSRVARSAPGSVMMLPRGGPSTCWTRCNGSFVHAHTVERGPIDRPLQDVNRILSWRKMLD